MLVDIHLPVGHNCRSTLAVVIAENFEGRAFVCMFHSCKFWWLICGVDGNSNSKYSWIHKEECYCIWNLPGLLSW